MKAFQCSRCDQARCYKVTTGELCFVGDSASVCCKHTLYQTHGDAVSVEAKTKGCCVGASIDMGKECVEPWMHATMRCVTAVCSLFPFGQVFYRDGILATTVNLQRLIVDVLVAIPREWQWIAVEDDMQASYRQHRWTCWPRRYHQIAHVRSTTSGGFVLHI